MASLPSTLPSPPWPLRLPGLARSLALLGAVMDENFIANTGGAFCVTFRCLPLSILLEVYLYIYRARCDGPCHRSNMLGNCGSGKRFRIGTRIFMKPEQGLRHKVRVQKFTRLKRRRCVTLLFSLILKYGGAAGRL